MHGYACQRRTIPIFSILIFALGLSACASFLTPEPEAPTATPSATLTPEPPTATPEPVAFTVNGEGIPVEQFNAEVQRYLTSQEALGKPISTESASAIVQDDLIAQLRELVK